MKWLKRIKLPLAPLIETAAGLLLYLVLARLSVGPLLLGHPARFQYALLGFVSVAFGPLVGLVTGLGGELILTAQGQGLWWSVIAAVALIGFWTGVLCPGKRIPSKGFGLGGVVRYLGACAVSQLVAFVVVCPVLDMLLYRESMQNILLRGAMDAIINMVVAWLLGSVALIIYGVVVHRPGNDKAMPYSAEEQLLP